MFNRISCLLLFLAFLGLGSSAIQAENSRETSEREIRFIIFIVNDGLFQIQTMMNKTNIIAWHSFYLHKRAEIDKLKTYVQEKKYDNSLVTLLDEYVDLLGESEILRIDINKIRMSGPGNPTDDNLQIRRSTQIYLYKYKRYIESMESAIDEILSNHNWTEKDVGGTIVSRITDKKEYDQIAENLKTIDPFVATRFLLADPDFSKQTLESCASDIQRITALIPPGDIFQYYKTAINYIITSPIKERIELEESAAKQEAAIQARKEEETKREAELQAKEEADAKRKAEIQAKKEADAKRKAEEEADAKRLAELQAKEEAEANRLAEELDKLKEQSRTMDNVPGARIAITINGVEFAFRNCLNKGHRCTIGEGVYEHTILVSMPSFWLMETEVTQAQWQAIMGTNPSFFKGADLPVENVSWDDCQEFCKKARALGLTLILPSETRWELACRAGTKTAFFWGNALNGDKANCDGAYPYGTEEKGPSLKKTVPVKSFPPNGWGLYDMHGNVKEWCQDTYVEDFSAITNDGAITSGDGSVRAVRGGGWDSLSGGCRSSARYRYAPDARENGIGFRCIIIL